MIDENLKFEEIKGGAALEMVNIELQKVFNDVVDPNKEPTSSRKVSVDVVFAPSDDGQVGQMVVRVKSTLGKQRDLGSSVYFGVAEGNVGLCSEQNRNQPIFGVMEAGSEQ